MVINDGSRDRTGRLLDEAASKDTRIDVIHQPNGGHGAALMPGTRGGERRIPVSDRQRSPDSARRLSSRVGGDAGGRDAVFGVRRRRHDPAFRLSAVEIHPPIGHPAVRRRICTTRTCRTNCSGARSGATRGTCIPDGTLAPSLFLAIFAKKRGYDIVEIDVTHKERDTGEVSIRRFKLLKFCARGLGADAQAASSCRMRLHAMPGEAAIVIVGAGPTGLGAAWRLHELGHTNWSLYEAARSRRRPRLVGRRRAGLHVGPRRPRPVLALRVLRPPDGSRRSATRGSSTCAKPGSGCAIAGSRIRSRTTSGGCRRTISIACLDGLLDAADRAARHRRPAIVPRVAARGFGAGHLRHLHVSLQPQGLGLRSVAALDVGWMGERVATVDLRAHSAQHRAAARRRELGAELDVPFPAARRHRRDLARGRDDCCPPSASHFDRTVVARSTPRKRRVCS